MTGGWTNFAVIAGSASGALTGLLFVAVSLNRDRIASHPALRSEAGQTLVLFLLALLVSLLLVVPGTSHFVLGLELVVLAVAAGAILIVIGRGKTAEGNAPEDRLARLLDTVSPNLLTMVFLTVAGSVQLAGDDGLFWLVPAVILALLGGVIGAWLFLTR